MKKLKSIQQILDPPPAHMVGDGFRVHNFFPSGYQIDPTRMSPFFMLDYGSLIDFSPREEPRGVGVHPHRGFETVTIAYQGEVAHHDSMGNSGVIKTGDIQWMTAGSGILHKEYHSEEYSRVGGPFQMVQLWVNLPAKYKMSTPKYQSIKNETINKYFLPNQNGLVEIIAGEYEGIKGSATTFSPLHLYNLKVKAGAEVSFSFPENFNTGILVITGTITSNGSDLIETDHFVLFKNDGTEIEIKSVSDVTVLILSGEPIKEPMVPYGPFLMNTKEEIKQAYEDLAKGRFGNLE